MPASLSPSPCPVPLVCLPSVGLDHSARCRSPFFPSLPLESPRIASSTAPPCSRSQMQMQTPEFQLPVANASLAQQAASSTQHKPKRTVVTNARAPIACRAREYSSLQGKASTAGQESGSRKRAKAKKTMNARARRASVMVQ